MIEKSDFNNVFEDQCKDTKKKQKELFLVALAKLLSNYGARLEGQGSGTNVVVTVDGEFVFANSVINGHNVRHFLANNKN